MERNEASNDGRNKEANDGRNEEANEPPVRILYHRILVIGNPNRIRYVPINDLRNRPTGGNEIHERLDQILYRQILIIGNPIRIEYLPIDDRRFRRFDRNGIRPPRCIPHRGIIRLTVVFHPANLDPLNYHPSYFTRRYN